MQQQMHVNNCNKIRVLFISHSSLLRGAEKSLHLLLKNINRDLIEPILITPCPGPIAELVINLGIKVYYINYGRWIAPPIPFFKFLFFLPSSIIAFRSIIRKEKIDLVYTNTMVIIQGGLVAKITGIPHIWHIRELLANNPGLKTFIGRRNTYKIINKLSTCLIAISQSVASPFIKNDFDAIHVIHNATDFSLLDINIQNDTIKNKENYFIGVIGELHPRKGQDDAIRAFYHIKQRIPNVKLILIGREDKQYGKYLRKIIHNLNIEKDIIFYGFKKEVKQIIANCVITLMPSWEEPFGRVTIESMALGVPVIGTNSGGTSEIIENGITGYLVPPKDFKRMAEKAIILLSNKSLRRQMSQNCQLIIKKKFTPKIYSERITEVILSASHNHNIP